MNRKLEMKANAMAGGWNFQRIQVFVQLHFCIILKLSKGVIRLLSICRNILG